MSLSDLPLEVQHQILIKLDAISLARAQCVCKLWDNIVTTPLFNLVWRQICLNDIEESVLVELTGVQDILMCDLKYTVKLDDIQKTNVHIWKYVYKKWSTNKKAGNWPVVKSEMKANEGS